jgi:hypothetical protein
LTDGLLNRVGMVENTLRLKVIIASWEDESRWGMEVLMHPRDRILIVMLDGTTVVATQSAGRPHSRFIAGEAGDYESAAVEMLEEAEERVERGLHSQIATFLADEDVLIEEIDEREDWNGWGCS